jgi:hypothetical protein
MKARDFKNLAKPVSAEKKAAARAEREALALYEAQLIRMCWKKYGYASVERAGAAIARSKKRNSDLALRSYKCPACIFWHITSTPLA